MTAPATGPVTEIPSSTAVRVAPWVALAAVVAILAGAVLLALPVENPHVQDCGVPAAFIVRGRVDVYASTDNPPKGLTRAQAVRANEHRCQERVAARAVPGGLLVLGGTVLGLAAAATEWIARGRNRRRALLQAAALGDPPAPPEGRHV